ncbi:MAG: outer membrane lipoprotein carrier protein LolA [Vicinamibacterales bacterium]
MPLSHRAFGLPLLLTLAGAAAAPGAAPLTPDGLAQAIQTRYETIRDFTADFEHSYRGGALKTQVVERGVATFKKPGMMRWVYEVPERKEFVSDGRRIYAYIPADRQVVVSTVPPDDAAPLPVLFLAGKGNVGRDFTASLPGEASATRATLKLVPRHGGADYAHMLLTVELPSLRIAGLTTVDLQGGTSAFTFTRLKENQGLSDKQFAFRIPKGVDVLTDDGDR